MRATILSLVALCWASAQVLSTALYRYYSESDIAEIREKTPLKWEGVKYEFSESYEIIAPPGASPQQVEAFQRQIDPRLFERHETEDRAYQVGDYVVVLKSLKRCQTELCLRFPQMCTPSSPQRTLSKVAQP